MRPSTESPKTRVQAGTKAGFSIRLRAKLALVTFQHATIEPGADCRLGFKRYLITLHTIIRASVPLMQAAELRSDRLGREPLAAPLGRYYAKHQKEEEGHDDWLLDDLASIGVPREEVLGTRPSDAVTELVGRQYYLIHHWHPVCLLGYISVMEGYPPQRAYLEELKSRTRFPDSAFRTLAKHSYLDVGHRRALYAFMDGLPMEPSHEEWVTLNAIYTLQKWNEIARSL